MTFSRRQFIQLGAVAAACAAVPLSAIAQPLALAPLAASSLNGSPDANLPNEFAALHNITKQQFKLAVGQAFKVKTGPSTSVWLTLQSVQDAPSPIPSTSHFAVSPPATRSKPVQVASYYLHFYGAPTSPLAEGTYIFEGGSLGRFALFISHAAAGQHLYMALISQLVESKNLQPAPKAM